MIQNYLPHMISEHNFMFINNRTRKVLVNISIMEEFFFFYISSILRNGFSQKYFHCRYQNLEYVENKVYSSLANPEY